MRILYACNDISYWLAHRASLAERMRRRGAEVAVICGTPPSSSAAAPPGGVRLLPLRPQAIDPVRDAAFARGVLAAARRFRPDAVHLITLKPILFGGLALRAGMPGLPRMVATFAGLGRVFAADPPDLRQRLVARGLRLALGSARTIAAFENEGDRHRLTTAGVVPRQRTAVVHGAGFDPAEFPAQPMPPGPAAGAPLRCLFAGRLLRAKGVEAVIDAAHRLAAQGVNARITLAGGAGGDPDAIPDEQLAGLRASGLVEVLGPVPLAEMPAVFARHHVLLMPTRYPEGSPRVLSEAASTGRPAIVSDHPGCTLFVRDGIEGVVLASPDGPSLAAAITRLAAAPEQLAAMGRAARARAIEGGFTIDAVADAYARLYAGP